MGTSAPYDCGDVSLHVRTWSRPAPSHPPAVLLPGTGLTAGDWEPVAGDLARTRTVHAVDLRGHGASDRPGTYSIELMAGDVVRLLPQLAARVDLVGHSLGGATAGAAMLEDQRITAGVNLDGTLFGPVVNAGLDRPFLLVASQGQGRDNDESWAKFWANLRGWRLTLQLTDSGHNSFSDLQALVPQTADALSIPPDAVQQFIGTIDPDRSIKNQRAYLTAFFDTHGLTALSAPLTDPAAVRLSAIAAAVAEAAHNRAVAPVLRSLPSGWRNLASNFQVKTYVDDEGDEHRI